MHGGVPMKNHDTFLQRHNHVAGLVMRWRAGEEIIVSLMTAEETMMKEDMPISIITLCCRHAHCLQGNVSIKSISQSTTYIESRSGSAPFLA